MTGSYFILAATFLWAIDTLFRYPLIYSGISASTIVAAEHLVLVAIFLVYCWVKKQSLVLKRSTWFSFIIIGGFGSAIGTLAFTQAFSMMNPSLVILLQKLQPIVAISLSAIILKERINQRFYAYLALCIVGSILLIGDDLSSLFDGSPWHYNAATQAKLLGYGLTLLAVVSWGASTVFGKNLSNQGLSQTQIMGGRFSFGLLFILPWLAIFPSQYTPMSNENMGSLLAMVLLSGLLGMYFYYKGLEKIPSHYSALVEMCFPVMAAAVNWIFLGFSLSPIQILGASTLLLANAALNWQNLKPATNAAQLELES
ncbi:DMT family transporter [Alginatibacterium sediminis]|uniref:DMT family transporter n=1 Tax=Alginatibacterium sediminis TaxID=2164068 RepID=A0A420E8W4_9ALTE|nr:DMT family transporter [Alginatibacterium sediminis]RKF15875.1 DMT family transporter [Alginatibacterium sediminis]